MRRRYSRLAIEFFHDWPDDVNVGRTVLLSNGVSVLYASDFPTALRLLPPGSEVAVVASGTVGDKTVRRISDAIRECSALVSLDLSAVTECSHVSGTPFAGNRQLAAIHFPGNLASISPGAFMDCTSLMSVTIPGSVQEIGMTAFSGCTRLYHLAFDDPAGWQCAGADVTDLAYPAENPLKFVRADGAYHSAVLTKARLCATMGV